MAEATQTAVAASKKSSEKEIILRTLVARRKKLEEALGLVVAATEALTKSNDAEMLLGMLWSAGIRL